MTRLTKSLLAIACVIVLLLTECAPKPKPPLVLLYESRKEALEGLDVTSLKGRTIVIDPGHGGVFRGALGPAGLDEANVNLGVALYLWGLLDEVGAEVELTRKTDRDFVGGDSLRLSDDLRSRVEVVNRIKPDVFISLHHNSGLAVDTTFNEIQIYFRMQDRGPSLDLARIVARHLRMNLGETGTRVLPGNYHVLRNSTVPAILCEPSYISNTQVESKLKLADKQRLEAEVYFIALADYFSRGIPQVTDRTPLDTQRTGSPLIEITFDPSALIDASTVVMSLDGENLEPFRLGLNRFAALPIRPLPSGRHTVQARARSIRGNSSLEAVWTFLVRTEPAVLNLSTRPARAHPVFPQAIEALVLDSNGNPVADSTDVVFSWEDGSAVRPTRNGRATAYVSKDVPFGTRTINASCADLSDRLLVHSGPHSGEHSITGFVIDREGKPVKGLRIADTTSDTYAVSDGDGYFVLAPGSVPNRLRISGAGYRDEYIEIPEGRYPVATVTSFYSGIPAEAVVTLDARGGPEETGWVAPSGVPASDLNLAVARKLAAMLGAAGIPVHLTRETDRRVTAQDRVAKCESVRSTLVVSIAHSGGDIRQARLGHYPGSLGGIRFSEYLSQEVLSLTGYSPSVGESDDYIVLQTSCPAVIVNFMNPPDIEHPEVSAALPVWTRAYGIFCSVVRYLRPDEDDTFTVTGRVTCGGRECGDALILIDGILEVMVGDGGEFTVEQLERGPHTAQAVSVTGESPILKFDESTDFIEIVSD